jgi:uncharacterized membrane protein
MMSTATYTGEPTHAAAWARDANGGRSHDAERLARALGIFSVGLGLTQILAPQGLARSIGVDDDGNRRTMRALGLREIATGVGLLTRERPTAFAWGRVAGDVMDLALLGSAFRSSRHNHRRIAAATAAVAGVLVLDVLASQWLSRQDEGVGLEARPRRRGIRVRQAATINRSPEEVYGFWRDLENLPRFMGHLESVRELDQRRSYWKVHAPLGTTVEWTAEIVEDRPNELIAWRSVDDAQVPNSGVVRFLPAAGERGTEVHLEITYDPPAGVMGATIAKLFGKEPGQQVESDLRRLKQVLETGEVVLSDSSIYRRPHAAQPPERVPSELRHGASRSFGPRNGGLE